MAAMEDPLIEAQLEERRAWLATAITDAGQPAELTRLLGEVDAALERVRTGSYGICKLCHEPIERERLLSDPLTQYCLDHLTTEERRELEFDLDFAAKVQAGLLPKRPLSFGGWEVTYHYEPARAVSGDYCDLVIEEDKGSLFFAVGDVSGKGVSASILMAHLHAMFRSLLAGGLALDQLLERANRLFCESTIPSCYATLVCGRASPSGEVEISNAGHCPPLAIQDGRDAAIEATGLPLGMFCSGQFRTRRLSLAHGGSLVLYSDGLTEARNGENAEYGAARLREVVKAHSSQAPQALMDRCVADVAAFRGGAPRSDDLTIMVIRRNGR